MNDPDLTLQAIYSGYDNINSNTKNNFLTHNLKVLWKRGITGKGVVIGVIDDGVQTDHIDLIGNYDSSASYNFIDDTLNPHSSKESHGTMCIGLISAMANNSICGVGAAYDAKFAALKVISSRVSILYDIHEASALSHMRNHISIYSMSWGPIDDGKHMARPNNLSSFALRDGSIHGRNGLGSIFIFSSGNGGRKNDFCAFDGYLQKQEVFVIGSIDKYGKMPEYSERCTAILVSTLSNSHLSGEDKIYTTYVNNKCGYFHSGTSVSAPIASAIIALLLQVNPNLSRRDIQHLLITTAIQLDNQSINNEAKFPYSLNFGFGLIDAISLIDKASNNTYKPLPPSTICSIPSLYINIILKPKYNLLSQIYTSGCYRSNNEVSFIETLILTITLSTPVRNKIFVYLQSPSGTTVPVIEARGLDTSDKGFMDWDIKVMAFYGEPSKGVWTLKIAPMGIAVHGVLISWGLRFYGHVNFIVNNSIAKDKFIEHVCNFSAHKMQKNLEKWCKLCNEESFMNHSTLLDPFAYNLRSIYENMEYTKEVRMIWTVVFISVVILFGIWKIQWIRMSYYYIISATKKLSENQKQKCI